ncbi:MAG: D-alanine--D-alanine ligase [Steroidobacteraceae bacterium]
MNKNCHVVVLMGGWSSEREVSLTSGKGVAEALRARGWSNVSELDMERDVAARLAELKPDIVFNALHGTPGEDGTVQGMMDLMGLKYTHSGLGASVIAIDKELTKMLLSPHGIRMPGGRVVSSESLHWQDPITRPYVVKPVNEGSSVGVAIITDNGNYGNPIGRDVPGPWNEFDRLLAEPFIKGRELTVAVLAGEPLAVTELRPQAGFYDYAAKYTVGLTLHICPADVSHEIASAMMDMAARAHELLGCKGASRSDFRWDDAQGVEGIFLLEVNTQPGMTPLSLVPEQAKLKGIEYGELVERLIGEALG